MKRDCQSPRLSTGGGRRSGRFFGVDAVQIAADGCDGLRVQSILVRGAER